MKYTLIIAVLALGASQAIAKPITRTFPQSCTVVFPAAEKLGSEKPYKMQLDSKTDMNLIVETGSFWKAGAAQIIVRFVQDPGGTCTVTDNSPYSGVRRNGTVFLDRLEKMLAEAKPEPQK
ncbi:MAG TPA: hypothetical protein VJX70_03895 [Candidatus Acidoferrum sp.]|nr:hypothetical protein [Candidatus Acidoferrum sp.]